MDIALKDIPIEGLELDLGASGDALSPILSELSKAPEDGEAVAVTPSLGGSMHILPIGGSPGYFVQGTLEGALVVACTRCLGPASVRIHEPFQFQLFPRGSVDSAGDEGGKEPPADTPVYKGKGKNTRDQEGGVELDSASLDVSFFDGASITLEALVREQLLLSMDDTSLCRRDCKGLCQGCGAELNTEACACTAEAVDPRFAILKGLKLPD